ncbi:MAG: biosynthetic-type acetolactate synthase large subunit [Bacillota bacterium]
MAKITGNELLIRALREEGVEKVFAYPGATVVGIFDELAKQDEVELILPRQELALVHAAEGYARSTGKVGVCIATSGPGATNLVTGIADANLDSVPLVCFTGQVPFELIGNDSFQEVDIVGVTRNICKYSAMVHNRAELNKMVKEAFYIASTGRPGPVLLDLPKDIMETLGSDVYPDKVNLRGYKPPTTVHAGQIKRAAEMIQKAKRPLFILGGGVKISRAQADMTKLIETSGIPAVTTVMGRGSVPTNHELYYGDVGMHGNWAANNAVNHCDILISIGTRFNDRITGKLGTFAPKAKIIHIDIDAASISKNVSVDVPIVGDAGKAIRALHKLLEEGESCRREKWIGRLNSWRDEKPLTQAVGADMPDCLSGEKLRAKQIIDGINKVFREPILTTDVGQHQMWTSQFFEVYGKRQLITSGGLGTMGYGLPSAIGAALGNPGREIVTVTGDGGFQMNSQELATAVINELPITICILNNGYLGMVRQWQELFAGKVYSGTCLKKRRGLCDECHGRDETCPPYVPDFVRLAEAYGAKGLRVFKAEEIEPALKEARRNTSGPTLIEFIIEDEDLVMPMIEPDGAITDLITEMQEVNHER